MLKNKCVDCEFKDTCKTNCKHYVCEDHCKHFDSEEVCKTCGTNDKCHYQWKEYHGYGIQNP